MRESGDDAVAAHLACVGVVGIAPNPSFARFDGTDQWVLGLMEVFSGMLVFGRVAASDMTALQAQT